MEMGKDHRFGRIRFFFSFVGSQLDASNLGIEFAAYTSKRGAYYIFGYQSF